MLTREALAPLVTASLSPIGIVALLCVCRFARLWRTTSFP